MHAFLLKDSYSKIEMMIIDKSNEVKQRLSKQNSKPAIQRLSQLQIYSVKEEWTQNY